MSTLAYLILALTAISAAGWIAGETLNYPLWRRVCGPLCAILLVVISVAYTTISVSFSNAITYSGATKDFVGAVVAAIDRGDIEAAHETLRKFEAASFETYEGGAFLQWLREPVEKLTKSGED